MNVISNFPNFKIENNSEISNFFIKKNGVCDFHSAISFVHKIQYGKKSYIA
jgi:hypothetical protein